MARTVTPLKLAIVATGRTQRDIASAVGLDEVQFSRVVNGHRTPSVVLAVLIAAAVSCSVEQLWPNQEVASDRSDSDLNQERLAA